jgi:hypothetical protein
MEPNVTFAQKSDVFDELKNSFDFGNKANEYADSTLDYIKKCYQQTSTDDIQYYARKAKNEIDYSKTQSGYAESNASDAEDEADDIGCDGAENEADDAEGNFNTAKSRFDDASTYLRRVENADDRDDAENNLRKAKNYVEEGISYLKYALADLKDAVEQLNRCQ